MEKVEVWQCDSCSKERPCPFELRENAYDLYTFCSWDCLVKWICEQERNSHVHAQ